MGDFSRKGRFYSGGESLKEGKTSCSIGEFLKKGGDVLGKDFSGEGGSSPYWERTLRKGEKLRRREIFPKGKEFFQRNRKW
jgi:hypothetical protein